MVLPLGLHRYYRQNHFLHGNPAVLHSVPILVQVLMVNCRVHEVVVFLRNNEIVASIVYRQAKRLRIFD